MELTKNEMKSCVGGGISWGLLAALSAAVVYVIGCFSGFTNPNRCSN